MNPNQLFNNINVSTIKKIQWNTKRESPGMHYKKVTEETKHSTRWDMHEHNIQ